MNKQLTIKDFPGYYVLTDGSGIDNIAVSAKEMLCEVCAFFGLKDVEEHIRYIDEFANQLRSMAEELEELEGRLPFIG
jgi:heme oxygenase